MSTLTAPAAPARPRYSRVEANYRILMAMKEAARTGDRAISPSLVCTRGRLVRRPDLLGLCDSHDRDDS